MWCRGEAPCSLHGSSGQREGSQNAAVYLTKAISEALDDFNSFQLMRADEAKPGRAGQNVRLAAFQGRAAQCQAPNLCGAANQPSSARRDAGGPRSLVEAGVGGNNSLSG